MVHVEKQKVTLRRASSRSDREREKEVETHLYDHGEARIAGTNIVVSVAVATFTLKGEDRYQVLRLSDDEEFRK